MLSRQAPLTVRSLLVLMSTGAARKHPYALRTPSYCMLGLQVAAETERAMECRKYHAPAKTVRLEVQAHNTSLSMCVPQTL
jgi:hypothetical protein